MFVVPGGRSHSGKDTFDCFVVRAACGACLITEGFKGGRLFTAQTVELLSKEASETNVHEFVRILTQIERLL